MARRPLSGKHCLLAPALALCLVGCQGIREISSVGQLRDGDLLFHVPTKANAITTVTHGHADRAIDHVAIFYRDSLNRPYVVEAIYDGVVSTPLFRLPEAGGYYLVGRVRNAASRASVAKALSYLGRPYDFVYGDDDQEIYCSELVLLSFTDPQGQPLFSPIPMTFRDSLGTIPPYWQNFYSQRNLSVPEGRPGSNPSELSRRKSVRILYKLTDFAKQGLQPVQQLEKIP